MHGLKSQNFFPAVGASGPATVHVNLGQAGFVFIEANVKKWGLAPMTGSLAPPPPYGSEQGSILLESSRKDGETSGAPARSHGHSQSVHTYNAQQHIAGAQHSRSRSGNFRVLPPTSPGPVRSPTDISLAHLAPTDEAGEASSTAVAAGAGTGEVPAHVVGLGLQGPQHPPPDYSSPEHSDDEGRRSSSESENAPLIRVVNRSRAASAAIIRSSTNTPHPDGGPPIPSYHDAVRQGVSRDRSNSSRSARPTRRQEP